MNSPRPHSPQGLHVYLGLVSGQPQRIFVFRPQCLSGWRPLLRRTRSRVSLPRSDQSVQTRCLYLLNPSITQSEDSLYFPPSLSDCCLPSHLDTEVTVHNIEAGQQRGDEVGLVAPHEGGGLVELLQHVALAHQQTEVVRELFLKRYSLLVSVSVLLESGVKVKHNTGLSKVIILTQQGRGL